ncbi:TetR/AcrR family transcriptional regulator [Streptomyces sp. Ag109_O5-10]|uniref:TetR/AcrR family transcriptional regulator n=1 Tax=Streptomyces sp. Ag109_O5-10 TaxID=1855349 RepID=UPI00089B7DB1|nr:TetR/AcrR family transcriptional regulator [Streptomyces sp. Ag109_O5-10]SEF07030.1 DNA-binding transcriptional regulator, AcrR family [Streptomyces sp. Ag109_O5-10]
MTATRGDARRREQVLAAALTVFATFGYRKTSMDAVARAADISRPGLYFLFSGKEELFRETVRQELDRALADVRAALAAPGADLEARLVAALDANLGRYVGTHLNEGVDELLEHGTAQLHDMGDDHRNAFLDALAEAITDAGRPAAGHATPRQIAEVLQAAGEGWKHRVGDRAEFVRKLGVAVAVALRT